MKWATSCDSSNWTRENLAWAAGIIEGEGCVSGGSISVTMGDEDIIRRLHLILAVLAALWFWLGARRRQKILEEFAILSTRYEVFRSSYPRQQRERRVA